MSMNDTDTNKERVVAFLPPDTIEKMSRLESEHGLKNHSEFVQDAVKFYISYLATEDSTEFLSPILQKALRENLLHMQDRVATNLFRLSLEMYMMMNILAATVEITDEELRGLRGRGVAELKKVKGKISLLDAVHFQRGSEHWEGY